MNLDPLIFRKIIIQLLSYTKFIPNNNTKINSNKKKKSN